jgi:hypothetical protein
MDTKGAPVGSQTGCTLISGSTRNVGLPLLKDRDDTGQGQRHEQPIGKSPVAGAPELRPAALSAELDSEGGVSRRRIS